MISVVLSIYNESKNPYFFKILDIFQSEPFFELVIIDGGSTDNTLTALKDRGLKFISLEHSSRGERLNFGIQQATFDAVLLHHPRSLIDIDGLNYLKKHYNSMSWLAFKHKFDYEHYFLKYISWYSNKIRVEKKNIVYLDHCMFFNKALLGNQTIPHLSIFEDTALSELLSKNNRAQLLPYTSTTSAIRFLERGIYKQFLMNQCLKLAYGFSFNHQWMNRIYERKLNLNQDN